MSRRKRTWEAVSFEAVMTVVALLTGEKCIYLSKGVRQLAMVPANVPFADCWLL